MYSADDWPIAAKMNFGANAPDGTPLTQAPVSVWDEQVAQVTDLGYRWIDPIDDWINLTELSPERFVEFKRLLGRHGVGVPAISFGRRSPVDVEHGAAHVAMMHRMLDLGAEIGAGVLNVGFMSSLTEAQSRALWFWHENGHVDDPALRPLAIERIRELGDHAQRNGMQISLEMYEDTYTGSAEEAVSFVRDTDHPAVGLNPDIGNLIRLHRPIVSYQSMFDQVLPYANYWHIKNYLRDEDPATGAYFSAPAPLESGLIDYRSVIRQALRLGYRGAFQTEHYGGDWLGVGAANAQYVRGVLRSASSLLPVEAREAAR
ncbi:sugar phosphate isomerase/epimerase family protein [Agrococcus beijingensis]|uniref:sugar phosphate isomerase/epimerase family protein n=1 Tax=Agrococcus beijingensis TaxID=3068634 RepID=UPI0027419DCE|nr:sugar phosphate isomerase/epimerase family protein [Agrococcus sp. REN33]